jgi:hypothetical protein
MALRKSLAPKTAVPATASLAPAAAASAAVRTVMPPSTWKSGKIHELSSCHL